MSWNLLWKRSIELDLVLFSLFFFFFAYKLYRTSHCKFIDTKDPDSAVQKVSCTFKYWDIAQSVLNSCTM